MARHISLDSLSDDANVYPLQPMETLSPDEALAKFEDKPYLARFTRRERQAIILTVVSMMTVREVAEYLGIAHTGVVKALKRIEKKVGTV